MITKIQPISIPTKGSATNFGMRVVGYEVGSTSATFYWYAQTDEGNALIDGNLTMSSPEIDSWGTDDNYVVDWALNQLGFTKDTTI